jgi:hypothetical protein
MGAFVGIETGAFVGFVGSSLSEHDVQSISSCVSTRTDHCPLFVSLLATQKKAPPLQGYFSDNHSITCAD